jgi:translocation and assembly module TamA
MRSVRLALLGGVASACSAGALAVEIDVEIVGLDPELEANVRAYLGIAELSQEAQEAEERADEDAVDDGEDDRDGNPPGADDSAADDSDGRVERAHRRAPGEIEAALRPFGLYAPLVRTSLASTGDGWTARYEIDPGPQTRIDDVDVDVTGEGRDAPPVREALAGIEIEPGDPLLHAEYEAAKSRLFDSAYNSGFIDAAYETAELRVRPDERAASVRLSLDTGPRYYFGAITVEQNILDAAFVAGFVDIEQGEPFDPDRLIDLQLALGDSGYFSNVQVDILRERAAEQHIPVVVHTTPRPNQSFRVGAGYGTDTGPRLRLGVELRRLNRKGHRFEADVRASARETSLVGEYRVPVGDLTTDYISYRASLGQEEIGDFDVEQASVGAAWTDLWGDFRRSLYVEARREDFAVGDAPDESEDVLYAGVRLEGQRSDDPLFTRSGSSWMADARVGSSEIAGSATFARLHVDGDYIRPLGPRGRLLMRAEYGATLTDDIDRLVPSQRFFAGGDRSVRGYEFESLGPEDANGATVGGKYLAVASIEADYLIVGNFGAAVFYDVGNASNDPTPSLVRAVGIGMRWRSPVGMLRVDLAHPLDDPDTSVRLHLSIGAGL